MGIEQVYASIQHRKSFVATTTNLYGKEVAYMGNIYFASFVATIITKSCRWLLETTGLWSSSRQSCLISIENLQNKAAMRWTDQISKTNV
jgi:hypothetical protein